MQVSEVLVHQMGKAISLWIWLCESGNCCNNNKNILFGTAGTTPNKQLYIEIHRDML